LSLRDKWSLVDESGELNGRSLVKPVVVVLLVSEEFDTGKEAKDDCLDHLRLHCCQAGITTSEDEKTDQE